MAITAADWTVTRATGKIAYTGNDHGGSPTYATVIELHRWLQDLADDDIAIVATGDELDITNTDPSNRSTDNIITLINGYTLDETAGTPASEHLYDGSIIQDGGDTIFDGFVNFGNASVVIQVLQDAAVISDDWWNLAGGTGANADSGQGISHRWMMQVRVDGVDIDGRRLIGTSRVMDTGAGVDHFTFSEFKINGTARGNNVFALTNADDLNNSSTETVISGWADFTNTPEGLNLIDVDADTVNEEYYSNWDTSGTHSQNDYYEYTKWLTRDGSASTLYGVNGETFRGITHDFAWDADAGTQPVDLDFVAWGTNLVFDTETISSFVVGEAIHEDTATPVWKGRVLAVDDNGAAGSLIVDVESGAITTADQFTGQTSGAKANTNGTPTVVVGGGVMHCLAVDDDGSAGNLYVQVIKGTVGGNDEIIYACGTDTGAIDIANTLTQNLAANEHTISTPFIGVSTGSNIIGAYGIGFTVDQIDDSDTLTALDTLQYSRPNLVTNTVGGLSQDGDDDRVIVAERSGVDVNGDPAINKDQFAINVLLDADPETTVTIGHANGDETSIANDTPTSGTIRVIDDAGYERFLPYTSWTGNVFTLDGAHPDMGTNDEFLSDEAAIGNSCYVTYIDENAATATLNYQATYVSPRNLMVVVRNGYSVAPIKQFISEWSFTSANQTLNAIRTTDL